MVKKEVIEKKGLKKDYSKIEKNFQVNKILVENFVSLQKVMTNLASKFDDLSNQISKLLDLFEISAKTLAKRDYKKEDNKELVEKLDSLLDQNKVIAKGIALMHEREMPEENEVVLMPQNLQQMPPPALLPREQMPIRQNIPRMSPQQMPQRPSQEVLKSKLVRE